MHPDPPNTQVSAQGRRLALVVVLLVLVCAGVWGVVFSASPKEAIEEIYSALPEALALDGGSHQRVAALLARDKGSLQARTQTTLCKVSGSYPDPECTPGSVFPGVTLEKICVDGYTKTVRNVPTKVRRQLYAAYGVEYPPPTDSYELDHLIPLALGGDNSTANLFPEAGEPAPGFKEKDVVEIYLYEDVCAGRLPLEEAQHQIAKDWLAVYQLLSEDTIEDIRHRYPSWAN